MITTILIFLAILAFLVLVHELGHFVAAIKMGVKVEEFGLGFPPRLISKKHKGVLYSLNLIPLGGFVKIEGEDGQNKDNPSSFASKKIWQKIIILSAGVGMNIIAGWLILSGLLMVGAPTELSPDINEKYIQSREIVLAEVFEQTPATEAGLKTGDVVLSVNNIFINNIDEFQNQISKHQDKEVIINYKRGQEIFTAQIKPKLIPDIAGETAVIGVSLAEIGNVKFPPHIALYEGAKGTYNFISRILSAFGGIIKNVFTGNGLGSDIGGPVAIAVVTNDVAKQGFGNILVFTAILSFNLAIINILPFPALDGGRILFLLIEKLRGKPSKEELEALFHQVGFALLILFAIFITYRDIARFGSQIWQAVVG